MVLGDRDQTEIEGSSSQDAQQSAIGNKLKLDHPRMYD